MSRTLFPGLIWTGQLSGRVKTKEFGSILAFNYSTCVEADDLRNIAVIKVCRSEVDDTVGTANVTGTTRVVVTVDDSGATDLSDFAECATTLNVSTADDDFLCQEFLICAGTNQFLSDWTQWTPWSSCSGACGAGVKERVRYCVAGSDQTCDGYAAWKKNTEEDTCNVEACPWNITGQSGDPVFKWLGCWTHSSALATSLEDQAFVVLDEPIEKRKAEMEKCAVAAYQINMTLFGTHYKQCWVPDIVNYRDGGPTYDCLPNMAVYIFTDKDPLLQIDGQWGPWEYVTNCSKPCDSGVRTMIRVCDNPEVSDGGLECEGPIYQNVTCNNATCPQGFAYKSIGCWSDGPRPLLRSMEAMPLTEDTLDLPVADRQNTVMKCGYVAFMFKFTVFGIKNGGGCYSSKNAQCIFDSYEKVTSCSDGLGSSDSLDVYSLDISVPDAAIRFSFAECSESGPENTHVYDKLLYAMNADVLYISQSNALLADFNSASLLIADRSARMDILQDSTHLLQLTAKRTRVSEAQSTEDVDDYVRNFVEAASALLDVTLEEAWLENTGGSSEMLLALETFSRSMSSLYTGDQNRHVESNNMEFQTLSIRTNEIRDDGSLVLPRIGNTTKIKEDKQELSVILSEDFLEELEREALKADSSEVFTSITIYNNLDRWLPQDVGGNNSELNSKLVTVVTTPTLHGPLKGNPIVLNMKHTSPLDKPELYNVSCVFWKYNKSSNNDASGTWSSDGCSVVSSDNETTVCHCDHLTSFAVLVKVMDTEVPAEEHQQALSVITYVCTVISLIALAVTFLVFTYLSNLNADRNTIHKNLVVALGCAQLLFLVGIDQTYNKYICTAIAGFLHFFYIAAFCWMLCEGIHLYFKVVQVFIQVKTLPLYYAIGWGFPVIIVAVSVGIKSDGYGTENYCWLALDAGLIWAFVGPMLVIILVNGVIMILVIRIIIQSSSSLPGHDEHDKMKNIRAGVKGLAILLPILGLSWVFGLLAIHESVLFFEYLFNIFNCLQGFFIFIFHCVGSSEVRAAYRRKQEQRALSNNHSVGLSISNTKLRSQEKTRQTLNTILCSTPAPVVSLKGVETNTSSEKKEESNPLQTYMNKPKQENHDTELFVRRTEPWMKPLHEETLTSPTSPTPSSISSLSLPLDGIRLKPNSTDIDDRSISTNKSSSTCRLLTPLGATDDCSGLAAVEFPASPETATSRKAWNKC